MNEIQISQKLDQARGLVEEGKFLHAIQLYERLIHAEPSLALPYIELATLYAQTGMLQASIRLLRIANERMPEEREIVFYLGNSHLQLGEYETALSYYKKLAGQKLPKVHFNMGVAYFFKNQIKQAEEQFRLVLKYDPKFPKVNESLGELLIRRQAYTEAIDCLKRGLTSNPYSAVNHHLLGVAYSRIDSWKRAYDEFILAVDMDPTESINWLMCGESLMHLKRNGEAEPYIRKALELQPESVDALIDLGQLLLKKGDRKMASECIERALNLDPSNTRAQAAIGFRINKGTTQTFRHGRLDA